MKSDKGSESGSTKESDKEDFKGHADEEEDQFADLDKGLALIRRKTISVRADGVQAQFLNNITSIQESVNKF